MEFEKRTKPQGKFRITLMSPTKRSLKLWVPMSLPQSILPQGRFNGKQNGICCSQPGSHGGCTKERIDGITIARQGVNVGNHEGCSGAIQQALQVTLLQIEQGDVVCPLVLLWVALVWRKGGAPRGVGLHLASGSLERRRTRTTPMSAPPRCAMWLT